MDNSLTDSPTLGKNTPTQAEPWGKVPASWLDLPISPRAFQVLVLINQLEGQKLENQVGQEYLASRLRTTRKTISRAINELVAIGVLDKRSTWRSSVYSTNNPSKRTKMSTQTDKNVPKQRDKNVPLIHKEKINKENKQTSETEAEAPLERSASLSAVDPVKPFRNLSNEQRSQLVAFNQALEVRVGFNLDLNSLGEGFLDPLLLAFNQGLTPHEIASWTALKLDQQLTAKALTSNPIRNPQGFLVKVLPSWIEADLWSVVSSESFRPLELKSEPLTDFTDLFTEAEPSNDDPEAMAEAREVFREIRERSESTPKKEQPTQKRKPLTPEKRAEIQADLAKVALVLKESNQDLAPYLESYLPETEKTFTYGDFSNEPPF